MFDITVLLVFVFIASARSQDGKCPVEGINEPIVWKDILQEVGAIVSTKKYNISEMKFFVMTPSSRPKYVNPNGEAFDWSTSECLDKPILLNCHGWLDGGDNRWEQDLLSTFIENYDGCGISSDYSGVTKNFNYISSANEANNVGHGLYNYMNEQLCTNIDCSKQLQLHGHSLGSHTCGIAGYLLKQKNGIIVPRLMSSDAAGPGFNTIRKSDPTLHLTKESAASVINLKTSCVAGTSLAEWSHQQQIVGGACGCKQNQCPDTSIACPHETSTRMMRSTMEKDFPDVKLKKCSPCSCIRPSYDNPIVEDSLGWKSAGTPGVFKTGPVKVCLDLSHVSDQETRRKIKQKRKKLTKKMKTKKMRMSGCPAIPPDPYTAEQIPMIINATLDLKKYDTRRMKYYVMTPRSYPDFENPKGDPLDWSSIECEETPVLFSCHGWTGAYNTIWSIDLIRTFVVQYGGCAVACDYSGAADDVNYLSTVIANTGRVGEAIANYIAENICKDGRNCTQDLQIHGHSWGSHTCGVAGYLLGKWGTKPYRFLSSDAAGPYFNLLADNDVSRHLSPESALHVINVKTSALAGASKSSWAHQTQYIGKCGSNQDQCSKRIERLQHESCDHSASVFVLKSTMNKDFPMIKLNRCTFRQGPIPILGQCTDDQDYLGWRSEAKPGIYMIKSLPVCLNTTLDNKFSKLYEEN